MKNVHFKLQACHLSEVDTLDWNFKAKDNHE